MKGELGENSHIKMTFITKGNKLFYAACVAFLVSRMGTSGTYISRYLNIRTCDFRPLSVQLRCRANIFPTLLPRPWFRISPIGALSSHSVRVCPHLCEGIKRLNCRRDSQWFCEIVPCSVHFRRFLSNINKFRSTAMLLCDSSD